MIMPCSLGFRSSYDEPISEMMKFKKTIQVMLTMINQHTQKITFSSGVRKVEVSASKSPSDDLKVYRMFATNGPIR